METTNREELKILVLGAGAVGKTCLTLQYVRNEFVSGYTPTLEEVYEAPAKVDDSQYILQILDTAGTDECGVIREQFYHQCDGYLLVFSVTDRFSLQEIKKIQTDIKRQVPRAIPFLVVGNKMDMSERKISSDEGETVASMLGGQYIETSAKYHINVDRVFHTLVRQIQLNKKQTNKKKCHKKEKQHRNEKCSIL